MNQHDRTWGTIRRPLFTASWRLSLRMIGNTILNGTLIILCVLALLSLDTIIPVFLGISN